MRWFRLLHQPAGISVCWISVSVSGRKSAVVRRHTFSAADWSATLQAFAIQLHESHQQISQPNGQPSPLEDFTNHGQIILE